MEHPHRPRVPLNLYSTPCEQRDAIARRMIGLGNDPCEGGRGTSGPVGGRRARRPHKDAQALLEQFPPWPSSRPLLIGLRVPLPD